MTEKWRNRWTGYGSLLLLTAGLYFGDWGAAHPRRSLLLVVAVVAVGVAHELAARRRPETRGRA